jgi:hypothetical protein
MGERRNARISATFTLRDRVDCPSRLIAALLVASPTFELSAPDKGPASGIDGVAKKPGPSLLLH